MRSFLTFVVCIAEAFSAFAASVTSVGPMVAARQQATATLLPDGTVLIAGGVDFQGPGVQLHEEIYDPRLRTFRAIGGMLAARIGHAAAALVDGRVLLIGGPRSTESNSEIYDPATATFSRLTSMAAEHYVGAAVVLADGRVLAAGGKRSFERVATAEIYNPASGGWILTGAMSQPRDGFAAVRLKDGRVLVAGGSSITADLFDPATGVFTSLGSVPVPPLRGVLLPNGKVVLVGLGRIQTFDPSARTFRSSSVILKTYRGEALVLLPDGSVLIAGGNIDGTVLSADVLVYSPDTDSVKTIGALTVGRDSPTGTLLPDGTALIAGGFTTGAKSSAAAEIVDLRPRGRAVRH
ncbi:MAG: hypothetical protein DMF59_20390 [Acidobacteria bacterium]|nr:MAG: hypothetical protein DMF59_20390 [Acidobacteriota bacterium]